MERSPLREPVSAMAPSPKRATLAGNGQRTPPSPQHQQQHQRQQRQRRPQHARATHESLLADQLVAEAFRTGEDEDAAASPAGPLHSVQDPLGALDDQMAFKSRDLLMRTPAHPKKSRATADAQQQGKAWKESYASLDSSLPSFKSPAALGDPALGGRLPHSPRLRRRSTSPRKASGHRSQASHSHAAAGDRLDEQLAFGEKDDVPGNAVRFNLASPPPQRASEDDSRPGWHPHTCVMRSMTVLLSQPSLCRLRF